jgi:hypothetical protein
MPVAENGDAGSSTLRLLHGSGRNRTDGFRRAISTHYASKSCKRADRPHKREPVTADIPD